MTAAPPRTSSSATMPSTSPSKTAKWRRQRHLHHRLRRWRWRRQRHEPPRRRQHHLPPHRQRRRRRGEQAWLPHHPPGELCAAAHAGQKSPACSPPAVMRPCRRDARCRRRRPSAHDDARARHPLPSPRDTLLPARPPRPPRERASVLNRGDPPLPTPAGRLYIRITVTTAYGDQARPTHATTQ